MLVARRARSANSSTTHPSPEPLDLHQVRKVRRHDRGHDLDADDLAIAKVRRRGRQRGGNLRRPRAMPPNGFATVTSSPAECIPWIGATSPRERALRVVELLDRRREIRLSHENHPPSVVGAPTGNASLRKGRYAITEARTGPPLGPEAPPVEQPPDERGPHAGQAHLPARHDAGVDARRAREADDVVQHVLPHPKVPGAGGRDR